MKENTSKCHASYLSIAILLTTVASLFSLIFTINFTMKSTSNGTEMTKAPNLNVGQGMYIDLLKRGVLNYLYQCHPPELECVSTLANPGQGHVDAKSMIGMKGLNMVENAIRTILLNNIPGDLIETGVFKGGTSIFMLGMLKAMGDTKRIVYVADSFEGIPPVSEEYAEDVVHAGSEAILPPTMSLELVRENFFQFNLLDDVRLRFLKGWFKDTLPVTQFGQIALLRMDGDLFESTWDALINLYDKVSIGGYIIVDDYGDWIGCKKAVDWFREFCGEVAPLSQYDSVHDYQVGKFGQWQKSKECQLNVTELNRLRKAKEQDEKLV